MFPMLKRLLVPILGLWITGCEDPGSNPVTPAAPRCADPDSLELSGRFPSRHQAPMRMAGAPAALPGTAWASPDSVAAFFGGKDVKLVFTVRREMYLLAYSGGAMKLTLVSRRDESLGGQGGSINSPQLSPDGKKILFAGTAMGRPAFILDAASAPDSGWRMPIDPKGYITADPHWHVEGGKTYVYFSSLNGVVQYSAACARLPGGTYRMEVRGDTAMGPMEPTGIAGAYRGGLSRDGQWAGTSYSTSALFNRAEKKTIVLAGGAQQCNPSMNPFPAGSRNTDYMMILAFGGRYASVSGEVKEELHENLWIYNKDNLIVWRAKRPDSTYERWDKPEWSTHPRYASAVALRWGELTDGDLVAVKIGDLADAPADALRDAEGFLVIGRGGFTTDSYSHMWVAD